MESSDIVNLIMTFIVAGIPSVLSGIFMTRFNKRQNKKDEHVEKRAETRREESLLALELNMANAKLSYAVAMAIKRGTPNGEVEEGIDAYQKALTKYTEFLKKQAINYMSENE